jgi:transposase
MTKTRSYFTASKKSKIAIAAVEGKLAQRGTTVGFFAQLKAAYPIASKIHIILDQSGYHRSQLVRDKASEQNIMLHYLPAYSPNLNSIERVWMVMNEECRNNIFFSSAKCFAMP